LDGQEVLGPAFQRCFGSAEAGARQALKQIRKVIMKPCQKGTLPFKLPLFC
jgi:hypothetical protein